jgi:polyisoprenoid-binding protein YceI
MHRIAPLAALALTLAPPALAEELRVDPDAGNNTFNAVFDAKLGERITAQSSAVACDLRYDEKTGLASGRCSVPLTSIKVDNEDTKTEHFQQWVTNRKSDPATCRLDATFDGVRIGTLTPEQPVPFTAQVPFTVCGRKPVDGRQERVKGTALLFPPGAYGEKRTVRIRATVEGFDRDAYHIGPKYTDGWLARAQSLAKVVADQGTIELSLFAKSDTASTAQK